MVAMGVDILMKILVLVPVETLIRCKCVCKWWYALINESINNPGFVAKHMSNFNTMHNNDLSACVLMKSSVMNPPSKENEAIFSLLYFCKNIKDESSDDYDHGHSFLSNVEEINIPHDMAKGGRSLLHIVGQCNGIICLVLLADQPSDRYDQVFLWNPTFGQDFKLLPPPEPLNDAHSAWPTLYAELGLNWDAPYNGGYIIKGAMGFGYDPDSNDYKVVNIGFSGSETHKTTPQSPLVQHLITYPPRATVYNMSTDSWAEINTDSLQTQTSYLWPEKFQMHSKGRCYWLGREQRKKVTGISEQGLGRHGNAYVFIKQVIISFETSSEVFRAIKLPNKIDQLRTDNPAYITMYLTVWNESTALFSNTSYGSFEIWTMDDDVGIDGGGDHWTSYLTINELRPYAHRLYWPLQMVVWGDEILTPGPDGGLVFYNIHTKEFKNLHIQNEWTDFAALLIYTKSIAPVKEAADC